MKQPRRRTLLFAGAALLAVGLVVLAIRALPPRKPTHLGKTVTEWTRQLGKPDRQAREDAAAALREIGPRRATPVLVRTLQRRESFYERAYLTNASIIPRPLKLSLSRLLKPYARAADRLHAARALELFGTEAVAAVPVLIDALGDPGPGVPSQAAAALAKMGGPAVAPLAAALARTNAPQRTLACFALWQIGPDAVEAVPVLIGLLHDPDRNLSRLVAQTLGRIGAPAADALVEQLKATRGDDRRRIVEALGAMGPAAGQAVRALIEAAQDDQPTLRSACLSSLGVIRPTAPNVVRALIAGLQDCDAGVRQAALASLCPACHPRARYATQLVSALTVALRDAAATNRAVAAMLLGQLESATREALPALNGCRNDDEETVRTAAQAAAAQIQGDIKVAD